MATVSGSVYSGDATFAFVGSAARTNIRAGEVFEDEDDNGA
jgi:hypothetical protein